MLCMLSRAIPVCREFSYRHLAWVLVTVRGRIGGSALFIRRFLVLSLFAFRGFPVWDRVDSKQRWGRNWAQLSRGFSSFWSSRVCRFHAGLLLFVAGNDIPAPENRIERIEVRAFAEMSSQLPSTTVLAFLAQCSQMFQYSLAQIKRIYFLPLVEHSCHSLPSIAAVLAL